MLKKSLVTLMSLGLGLLLLETLTFAADSNTKPGTPIPQEFVRARIGMEIQAGNEQRPAKAHDHVQSGDKFRIYAIPEPEPGYIYVVYADQETAEQLNAPEHVEILKDDLLALPPCKKWYQFDAKSPAITITIICSSVKLPELEKLFQTECAAAQWVTFETQLVAQSQLDLRTLPEKPWPLAVSTRGKEECFNEASLAFLEKLKSSSGKSMVVKKYEFSVQK